MWQIAMRSDEAWVVIKQLFTKWENTETVAQATAAAKDLEYKYKNIPQKAFKAMQGVSENSATQILRLLLANRLKWDKVKAKCEVVKNTAKLHDAAVEVRS